MFLSYFRIEILQALGFRGKHRRVQLNDLEKYYKKVFQQYQVTKRKRKTTYLKRERERERERKRERE
jgi:hypothetical protein